MLDSSKSPSRHRILYALPAFVLALPTIPVFVLLPTFYAETLGLGLAIVGAVFFGLRLLDVVSDPILGWISDYIPERYGKRKFPMAVGGILGAPALIMLLSPPETVTAVYLALWGGVLYLAWTAIQIPYTAWAVALESDYTARVQLNGAREGAGLFGIVAAGVFGIVFAGSPEQDRFQWLAWATVFLGIITFLITLWFTPAGRPVTTPKRFKLSFPSQNKLFLRVLGAWFINGLANGLPAVCLQLFVRHYIQADDQDMTIFLGIYFLFALLGLPLWLWMGKSVSKHRVWCFSMVAACLVFAAVPFLGPGDVIAFGVICALTGVCLGSDLALPTAVQADCADWDRLRFQEDRTGSLFAYWSMATKLALGVAIGIAFPVLGAFGLEDKTPTGQVSELSLLVLVVIYALLPIVLKGIAIAMMWRFPLGKKQHDAVRVRLERL